MKCTTCGHDDSVHVSLGQNDPQKASIPGRICHTCYPKCQDMTAPLPGTHLKPMTKTKWVRQGKDKIATPKKHYVREVDRFLHRKNEP